MSPKLPITAIVIFRNERAMLDRCLSALEFCGELIAVDMASTDGSMDAATKYADRAFRVEPCPIAEPARVAATRMAKHDWVLLVDPDEVIPPALAQDIAAAMRQIRQAETRPGPLPGSVGLPMRFYFKGRLLEGTIWGRPTHKHRLIHRDRCRVLPHCNRLTELRDGFAAIDIPLRDDNHVRHYWSDSYRKLFVRHVRRYCHAEAAAQAACGQRFSLRYGLIHPLVELYRCLRHYDGWRLGLRGWLLSAIYFVYVAASCWLVAWYQRRGAAGEKDWTIPPLHEVQSLAGGVLPQPERKAA